MDERLSNLKTMKAKRWLLRKKATEEERIIWKLLRNYQFLKYKFYRQYSFGPYIVDFYCHKLKLAIEIDGSQHGSDEGKEYDKERTRFLNSLGVKVVRFWNWDVKKNLDLVVLELEKVIDRINNKSNSP